MDIFQFQKSKKISEERIQYVDGIKGFACLTVIIAHYSQVFFPGMLVTENPTTLAERIMLLTPLYIFVYGNFGVHVFFVLTGFLICNKVACNKPATSPVKLYRHLLKVVAPSVMMAAILMKLNLMFHLDDPEFFSIQNYNNFEPHIFDSIYDIFVRTFIESSKYVGPLWTISYSYFGSLIAYATIYYARNSGGRHRAVVYLLIALMTYHLNPQMISFVLGGLAYEVSQAYKQRKRLWLTIALLITGGYLAFINRDCIGLYSMFRPFLAYYARFDSIIRSVGISICMVVIESTPAIQRLFSWNAISKVGRVSMYCYSMHWPVILSMGCGVYILLKDMVSGMLLKIGILIAVLITTFLLSIVSFKVEKLVDCFRKSNQKVKRMEFK